MSEDPNKKDTFDDSVPVFSHWRSWYTIVIIINVIIVAIVYFYFKSL